MRLPLKTKKQRHKVFDKFDELDRLLKVQANFAGLEFPVEFIGSKHYVDIIAEYARGKIQWKDDPVESGNAWVFRCLWEKGSDLDAHFHIAENEHIFVLDGILFVELFDDKGKSLSQHTLTREDPYLRIRSGVHHYSKCLEATEFIVTFEPWQKK